jgi:pSer/pThr/pTyr-binding forkhead associated (FHA) protein
MNLRLIVIEGPRRGEEFTVKDEIVIGRKKGDLQLLDDKASNLHAKVYSDDKILYIEDLGSSNGTLVNGEKIEKAEIKAGDVISIGSTLLRVDVYVDKKKSKIETGSWQELADKLLASALQRFEKLPVPVKRCGPFTDVVELEFTRGLQAGSSYFFGFGPRQIGAHCSDALLFEPDAPGVAFELHPSGDAVCEFRSSVEGVLVNNVQVKSQKLKNGDRISFGQTIIVVKTS